MRKCNLQRFYLQIQQVETKLPWATQQRPKEKVKVRFKDWAKDPQWITFRKNDEGHVPAKILDLMQLGIIGARKRKKKNDGKEQKYPDVRKWCFFCSQIKVEESRNRIVFKRVSRFGDFTPRKSSLMCSQCLVPLCHGKRQCFARWHSEDFVVNDADENEDENESDDEEERRNDDEIEENEDENGGDGNDSEINDVDMEAVFGGSDSDAIDNVEAV